MHDIRFIRESPETFDAGLKKRNLAPLSAELLEIDKRRRAAISESEALQARRKALSQQIGIAKRKGEPAETLMAEVAATGVRAETYFYDAGHAFFNDTRAVVYNPDAAALAWERTLEFLRQTLV